MKNIEMEGKGAWGGWMDRGYNGMDTLMNRGGAGSGRV